MGTKYQAPIIQISKGKYRGKDRNESTEVMYTLNSQNLTLKAKAIRWDNAAQHSTFVDVFFFLYYSFYNWVNTVNKNQPCAKMCQHFCTRHIFAHGKEETQENDKPKKKGESPFKTSDRCGNGNERGFLFSKSFVPVPPRIKNINGNCGPSIIP